MRTVKARDSSNETLGWLLGSIAQNAQDGCAPTTCGDAQFACDLFFLLR